MNQNDLLLRFAARAPGFIYTFHRKADGRGCMSYASPGIRDIFGLEPDEVMRDIASLYARVHPDDLLEGFIHADAASAQSPSPLTDEFRVNHSQKGELWVEVRATPEQGADGSIIWHGLITDISERKRMEAAQKSSWDFLRGILDILADPIFVKDRQHRWVFLNGAFCKFIGRPLENLLGKSDHDLFPEYQADVFREKDESVFCSGLESINEEDFTDADGAKHTILTKRTCYSTADGQRFLVGAIRDITERKRTEDVLKFIAHGNWLNSGEEFLTALARYLGGMLGVDYVIIDKLADDPAYGETVAIYAKGEVVPNMQYSLQHSPCDNVVFGRLCCYPKNVQQQFPMDRLLVDMQVESYAGIPLWDTKGEVIGLIAIMDGKPMNNTELVSSVLRLVATSVAAELNRRQMEEHLRTREREFRSLAENSPDTIVRYDREGRFVYANPLFEKLRGVRLDELRGKTPMQIPALPYAEFYQRRVQGVIETGTADEFVLPIVNRDGTAGWRMSSVVPELDAEGQVVYALVMSRDITALKEAELQLEKSRARLRQLLTHLEDSHEQERKQMSWDMHEDLLQTLVVTRISVTMLQSSSTATPAHIAKTIQSLMAGLDKSILLVRKMAITLRPSVLNFGILAALEWLVDEFVRQYPDLACKLEVSEDAAQMDEKSSLVIFRIVQESLLFTAKCKASGKVSVSLGRDACGHLLTIRDNSKGNNIDLSDRNFLSFYGLQERVLAMCGEMVVFSAPDHGLIIEARLLVQDVTRYIQYRRVLAT